MNMKLTTLFAAALAVVGFCKTASAVTYPLPTDGSRLVGQNQVVTVEEVTPSHWNILLHNTSSACQTCWKPTRC
jgi:lipoprotein-anchoring transpeptidase ErfK/SrfK